MILASFTLVFSFILLNIVILPNSSRNTKYIHTKNSQSSPVWWMTNNLLKSTLCFFFRLCDETFCCENGRYYLFFFFWKEIDKLALRWLFGGSAGKRWTVFVLNIWMMENRSCCHHLFVLGWSFKTAQSLIHNKNTEL